MKTLQEWLAWQQAVHPEEIELGLARVRRVWQRLGARRPAPRVITVGGTNGKGSTVALLEAMLQATGLRTGCYTSPHLVAYNERIRIDGRNIDDATLIAVFERIEAARGDVPLTWFEYGTLAALECMADAGIDVALLEVGLGGRLDAVNIVDADVAIVTAIGIDHVAWLGPDRDSIGREKAGIFRAGRPAIVGDPEPPTGLLEAARACQAQLWLAGRDFGIEGVHWFAASPGATRVRRELDLPATVLEAPGRHDNVATALAALLALAPGLPWQADRYAAALADVVVPGRLQRLADTPAVWLDVAHNPQAAGQLARWLDAHPVAGRTLAVFGAMQDKDVAAIAACLGEHVAHWYCCGLPEAGERGRTAADVAQAVRSGAVAAETSCHTDPLAALVAARSLAAPVDRILAFGSFHVAGALLAKETTPT